MIAMAAEMKKDPGIGINGRLVPMRDIKHLMLHNVMEESEEEFLERLKTLCRRIGVGVVI